MKNENAFEANASEYDQWFDQHPAIYQAEVLAVLEALPVNGKGIEIGTGTGRFSSLGGIAIGVEPSENMAKLARERGMIIVNAVAENLPFHKASFDFVLMVTVDCFLKNIQKAFEEAHRVLKQNGAIIIGLIDKRSILGKKYEEQKSSDKFYRDAHFHSTEEITALLKIAGFTSFQYWQTLAEPISGKTEQPQSGYGKGSFVVIKAQKQS